MEKYLLPVDKEKTFIVLIACLLAIMSIFTYIFEDSKNYVIGSIAVSLNESTPEQIMCLPGIWKHKAYKIYFSRLEDGNFKNILELKRIRNISSSSILKIQKYVKIENNNLKNSN